MKGVLKVEIMIPFPLFFFWPKEDFNFGRKYSRTMNGKLHTNIYLGLSKQYL